MTNSGPPSTQKELRDDRDYWLRKAKALEIAHDRLADKLEAVKKALHV